VASGNRAEAQKVLDHLKEFSTHSYVAPFNVAVIYVSLGEKDEAFAWLNRAYEERSYTLAEYLTTDARLDTLHSDRRFAELVRRIFGTSGQLGRLLSHSERMAVLRVGTVGPLGWADRPSSCRESISGF
jgi:hypothetical protein